MAEQNADLEIELNLIMKDVHAERFDSALENTKKLCATYPKNDQVWQVYGYIEAQRRNFSEARKGYCRALALVPFSAQLYQEIAVLYEEMGKHDLAKACHQTAQMLSSFEEKEKAENVLPPYN